MLRKNTKITATAEELAEMYREGNTLQQIGDKFGATREAVRQHLEKAGFVVMSERALLRATKRASLKPLADSVLIESCNRKVKEIWKKKRQAEASILRLKASRNDLINGVNKTLGEIQKACALGLKNKKQSLLALKVIQGLTERQAEDFEKYKVIIRSYNAKDYDYE